MIVVVFFQWFNNCGITLRKRKFYYNVRCNGVCLKENISIPVKVLVNSNGRCHNPRCSGVNPTFFWEKNQKLYCSVECCDGYQEWQNEVSNILPHFSKQLLSTNGINGWGYWSTFL
jgi:hypothetical protein